MIMNDKLTKPIIETKYLTVENADRYRCIVRLFYLEHEKLKYWLYHEEVLAQLREDAYFKDYTEEQCRQDLSALVSWGNLSTVQDTKKVTTIEEFKNKKFRYQLTDYSIEIERMVIRLENLSVEGASLESSLLERMKQSLSQVNEIIKEDDEKIHSWWRDLNNDFKRLNENYQDYMRDLNSVKAEEMMKTKEFLVFKDHLIEYLRSFVKSLQQNATTIEQFLTGVEQDVVDQMLDRVVTYELSIPRIDGVPDENEIYNRMKGRWENIYRWFLGSNQEESEAGKVFDTTNEIIRRITRYAARISEQSNSGANRREEYAKIASIFGKCKTMEEAHRFSSVVFGIEKPLHLKGDFSRNTESINSGVYEEDAVEFIVTPRVRNYREKSKRTGIIDRTREKEAMREKSMRLLRQQQKLLDSYVVDQRLEFAKLPEIEPYVRDTFLMWLSKALERKDKKAKTEDGRQYYIEKDSGNQTCKIQCSDGVFSMPSYVLVFEEE